MHLPESQSSGHSSLKRSLPLVLAMSLAALTACSKSEAPVSPVKKVDLSGVLPPSQMADTVQARSDAIKQVIEGAIGGQDPAMVSNAKFTIDPKASPEELQLRLFHVSRDLIHAFLQTPDGRKYVTIRDNRADGLVDHSEFVRILGETKSERSFTDAYSNNPEINRLYSQALRLYLQTYPIGSPQDTK
ncbi:hypothetical protein KA057_00885 [Candidatus Gracilibacteria bacterium]|nr:hypothetical protein [Candidatus Gracilibacteria bacterium]